MAYSRPERVTVATSDDIALAVEDEQDVTGQGPGHDAFGTSQYQRLELDDGELHDARWPLLRLDSVSDAGPLVIHAIPLATGETVIGVLTLYQRGLGRRIDLEAAPVVARAVAAALVADLPTRLTGDQEGWSERAEVHQATGMVVAQLGVPEEDALALIRAHAYSHEQSVGRSAHAVVTRTLRFSASPDQQIEST